MNELIKNLGVIVLIIGAAVLAVPFFTGGRQIVFYLQVWDWFSLAILVIS